MIGTKLVDDLLSRNEIMRYETDFLNTIHYAEAIAGMGALEFSGYLNDDKRIQRIMQRYDSVLSNFEQLPAGHVDGNVVGVLPLQVYLQSGGEKYKSQGLRMADQQWENPRENGLTNQTRFWIDDLYMIGILQKKAFEVTSDSVYLNRAAQQFAAYLKRLQQPNGLFYHGEEAPFYWGRGNGWVAVAMAELLDILPKDHPQFNIISGSYRNMMKSLLEHQGESGMWRQLIDVEDAWEESSATAMFGYAIKLGVDAGILNGKLYKEAYQKAWLALVKKLNEKGQLKDICVGTGKSNEMDYYLNRPVVTGDLHGQAPMLWFALHLLEKQ